jgi:hypothetical protein
MTGFTLYCLGEGGKKGEWVFEPFKDGMNVFDADDRPAGWFSHQHAQDRFTLPSFWRSIKNVGFTKDDGATVWFAPDREAVAAVKDYLDWALASQGEEAVRRFAKRGWLHTLAGLGFVVLGVAALLIMREVFGDNYRVGRYGFAALILFGIGETAWGISALLRSGRLKRRLRRGEGR